MNNIRRVVYRPTTWQVVAPAFVPFCPRLFPFWSIWETNAGKKKQKQEKVNKSKNAARSLSRVCSLLPTFVPILVDLGNKRRKKETKARTPPTRYALSSKAGWRACEERNTQTSRNTKQGKSFARISQPSYTPSKEDAKRRIT